MEKTTFLMAFSNILQKIFKSSGQGPEVNDGILSKDITIQSWSSTHNYLPGTLVKTDGGGASSKIYFAKQSTGPSESVGPQDPSLDTGNTYWSVVSTDDGNVVHRTGDTMTGSLTITDGNTLKLKHTGITRGTAPSANAYPFFVQFKDNADKTIGGLYYTYSTGKEAKTYLMCYQGTSNADTWQSIGVGYNASGDVFTWAPTPATSSNDTNIATTAFVKAQGYLTSVSGTAGTSLLTWDTENTVYTVGGHAIKVKLPANPNTDTHWTSHLYAGASNGNTNAATTNGNTYLIICDNSTARDRRLIKGTGATTVTSDANGNITINSTDNNTWNALKGATSSANGTAGYAPAPPSSGYNTKYLRADGTWQVPPDNNTTYSVSTTGSGNAVTSVSLSGTAITATKGSTFLTSHQSLSNYVDRSTTQEISGNKKFMSGIERWGDNAHIKIFNTGLAKYSTKPSEDKSGSLGLHANDSNTLASFGFIQYSDAAANRAAYIRCYVSGSTTYRSVNLNPDDNAFFPGVTKQLSLGRSDRLWTVVYAQTGSINTSDEREKQAIEIIPDNILDAWEEISWKQFKLNDSVEEKGFDKARLHTGLIAQQIDTIFKNYNLDISKYGLFCYDEWGESPAETNDDGEVVSEPLPSGNQYAIRYEEALCVEAAYNRREVKRLKERLSRLEERLAS